MTAAAALEAVAVGNRGLRAEQLVTPTEENRRNKRFVPVKAQH
jgi:hypothetical protein